MLLIHRVREDMTGQRGAPAAAQGPLAFSAAAMSAL
jgi:hypothetical protein